jgi:hypothetical protein
MKKLIIFLYLLALLSVHVFCQNKDKDWDEKEHEAIQQIKNSGLDDILRFQTQNQGIGNLTMTQQSGNLNKSSVSQQFDGGSAFANQAYGIQQGNSNEMTIGQVGNGNLLLGFQFGTVSSEFEGEKENKEIKRVTENCNTYSGNFGSMNDQSTITGEGNALNVNQNGNKNAIVAIQQGSENNIEADQNGTNNYLVIYQKGKNNEVIGYNQENYSGKVLAETIIQEGENLSLSASDASKSKPNGNAFLQKGINLSLEVNNQFTNTLGGIEVNQKGHDMKVIIDQSFFSFPAR